VNEEQEIELCVVDKKIEFGELKNAARKWKRNKTLILDTGRLAYCTRRTKYEAF
jgi:hypothetical protein